VLGAAAVVVVAWLVLRRPFPSDRTPDGAYLRIALALNEDRPRDAFPYLETEAQWASYTIRDTRAKACERVRKSYPAPEQKALLDAYGAEAAAPDGADVFALEAAHRGWIARLRRDLSGVRAVEIEGERATVVTTRGTRYPFRRRDNGIWGLTIFTADLLASAEHASRDLEVVEAAATDFDRAGSHPEGSGSDPKEPTRFR
jgi:hypothetical protein